MMTSLCFTIAEETRYVLSLEAIPCGQDWSVTIIGGCLPHVGAVALGCARPQRAEQSRRSATVSVICAYEHKDDELARRAAEHLATELNCRVSVTAGVHIDDATKDEILILLSNTEKLCEQMVAELNGV